MLRRLSESYGIPVPVLIAVSTAGLIAFCAILGIATYWGLVELWPEIPMALALSGAIFAPPAFVLGVGVVCAIHDTWLQGK